ncbi:helix-turn-helix domain-containing protein [Streptomyces sparsus]
MSVPEEITAWQPPVAGITEVFHARFTAHAYPMHTHAAWTVLVVDAGMVTYDLDRHRHGTPRRAVTLLPPHVPHNGRSATDHGFRKRVLYLEPELLGEELVGPAVDSPVLDDPLLRDRVHRLHDCLREPGDEWEAECRLALVRDRIRQHLRQGGVPDGSSTPARDPRLARLLRELIDAHVVGGLTLREAASALNAHPSHLVRAFSGAFGMAPHQYLTGLRIDRARRLLLRGVPAAEVATTVGFYDQAHLGRHFKRVLGTSPGRFARTGQAVRPASGRARTPGPEVR